MQKLHAQVLLHEQMTLGEGPIWRPNSRQVQFVDIESKKIYSYDVNSKQLDSICLEKRVGCIVPTKNGNLVAGATNCLLWINPKTKEQKVIQDFHLKNGMSAKDAFTKYGIM